MTSSMISLVYMVPRESLLNSLVLRLLVEWGTRCSLVWQQRGFDGGGQGGWLSELALTAAT